MLYIVIESEAFTSESIFFPPSPPKRKPEGGGAVYFRGVLSIALRSLGVPNFAWEQKDYVPPFWRLIGVLL